MSKLKLGSILLPKTAVWGFCILTLGVVFAACENEQLTKDDVKSAVKEEMQNSGGSNNTVESVFKSGLEFDGYTVSGSLSSLTVSTETSSAALTFGSGSYPPTSPAVSRTFTVYEDDDTSKTYTTQLKLRPPAADVIYTVSGSNYTVSGASIGSAKSIVFDFQIFDSNGKKHTSGTITLSANPTEAGALTAAAAAFESDLMSALQNNYRPSFTEIWTDKEITAWGQTDAKFSAAVNLPILYSGSSITLPGYSGSGSIPYIVTWTSPEGGPTGASYSGFGSAGSRAEIAFGTSLEAGTITIPFTLTSTSIADKTVSGTLVITTKN
jgi:hypothetical protein